LNTRAQFVPSLLVLLIIPATTPGQSLEIRINEFLASNQITNMNPEFKEFSDWIELYNTTHEATDLSGYYVSP
jgi:hypothetical protein